jgi:predicted PurR-regulated permease PerM
MLTPSTPAEDSSRDELRETSLLIERLVVILLFAGLLFGVAQILRPFVTAILFGTILVISTWPLRQWVVQRGVSRGLTTLLFLVAALAILVVPAVVIAPRLSARVTVGIQTAQAYIASTPETPAWLARLPLLGPRAEALWSQAVAAEGDLREIAKPYATQVGNWLVDFARAFAESILQVILSLAVATMLWLRGDVLKEVSQDIAERLGGEFGLKMLNTAAGAVRGVAYGVVGTAGIQAVAMTLGLFVAGVPNATLLGFLSLLIAISQIGVLLVLVWGGAAWWLFSSGEFGWGVFMLAWGLFVSTVDNVIRPWLVSFGAPMPLTLVFLGVFGGFIAFGFLGLFIGPAFMAILYALLDAWRHRPKVRSGAPVSG